MAFSIRLTVLATIGLWATDTLACSCAGPGPNRCVLPASPVSFVGKAISKQAVDLRPAVPLNNRGRRLATDPPLPRDESYIAVVFQVSEWFGGGSESTVVVRTDPANSSCTYPFEVGHDYLVFAYTHEGNLRTDPCAGTRPVAPELALIHQLRSARAGTGMADMFGMAYVQRLDGSLAGLEKSEGVQGLIVTAKSDRGEYETVTSADGSYEFWALPSDRYVITAQPPTGRYVTAVRTLDVGRGTACRADFQVSYDGRITGSVTNSQGQPLNGTIGADLIEAGKATGGSMATRVTDGRFEFKLVPPGRYRLRFWPMVNGRNQSDEASYYPGTRIESAAAEIEIGDGTHVDGLQFTIP